MLAERGLLLELLRALEATNPGGFGMNGFGLAEAAAFTLAAFVCAEPEGASQRGAALYRQLPDEAVPALGGVISRLFGAAPDQLAPASNGTLPVALLGLGNATNVLGGIG